MIDLKGELYRITDALNRSAIDYAICGGIAVAIHGYPRATNKIDLLIPIENLAAVQRILAELGYDLESGIIPFEIGGPNERRVFRVSRAVESVLHTIDLILVSSVFAGVWTARDAYDVEGHVIHVVSREGLIRMKEIAGRAQDLADIDALRKLDT